MLDPPIKCNGRQRCLILARLFFDLYRIDLRFTVQHDSFGGLKILTLVYRVKRSSLVLYFYHARANVDRNVETRDASSSDQ